ncbi:MAG: hypothetical protein QOF29_3807 [bacterium]
MDGAYETVDGRPALRFERRLAHPVDAVWRAVTEPGELAHWFPCEVDVDLRPGGRMTFTFPDEGFPAMDGQVIELDPPNRFAFLWGDELLRFELEPGPGGEGCVLRFTHILSARDQAARDAAGWHVCLDRLQRRLAGEPATAPTSEPTDEWRRLYEEYERRGLPTGAERRGREAAPRTAARSGGPPRRATTRRPRPGPRATPPGPRARRARPRRRAPRRGSARAPRRGRRRGPR